MKRFKKISTDVLYVSKITKTKNKKILILISVILSQLTAFTDIALIGHEPSISESLKYLIINYRADLSYALNNPYPTGGLAIIHFDLVSWKEIDEKTGILDAFITPSYLVENEKEN